MKPHLEELEDRTVPSALSQSLAKQTVDDFRLGTSVRVAVVAVELYGVGYDLQTERAYEGLSSEEVMLKSMLSPRYAAAHPDDGEFVRSLYVHTLHRQPSPSEVTPWLQIIQVGGRLSAARDIVYSVEARWVWATRDYAGWLGRGIGPTELHFWNNIALDEIDRQVMGSYEFEVRVSQQTGLQPDSVQWPAALEQALYDAYIEDRQPQIEPWVYYA